MKKALTAFAMTGALAASGCGTVDTPKLEGKIEEGLKEMADLVSSSGLEVRMQLQMHKQIWGAEASGV